MKEISLPAAIAVIGGGPLALEVLRLAMPGGNGEGLVRVLGVSDADPRAPAVRHARSRGVPVTADYRRIFHLPGLQALAVTVDDQVFLKKVRRNRPSSVKVLDSHQARALADRLRVLGEKKKLVDGLKAVAGTGRPAPEAVLSEVLPALERFTAEALSMIEGKNRRLQAVEKRRLRHDRMVSQIIHGSTIPTFVINENHVVTHWNQALEQVTGRRAEEMVGTKNHWTAFYEEKKPCLADLVVDGKSEREIRKHLGKRARPSAYLKGSYEAENFYPHMGEKGKWLYFTAAPLRGPVGETLGAIETLWDVTAQREAREKLKEIEAIEASILDTLHVAALVLRERRIFFANEAAESVFGWKAGDLIGKNTRVLYPCEAVYQSVGKAFYEALEQQRSFSGEYPCVRRDGREILCMVRASRIGERLKEQAIVATYEDITEQKKAEAELRQREYTLFQIIEGSTIPTFVIDRDHRVTHWNRAIETLTGKTAREMVGTKDHWKAFYPTRKPIMSDVIVDRMSEEKIGELYGKRWRKSVLIDKAYEAEDFFPHMGESGKWLYFTGAPLEGPDGTIVGAIETLWDITDSKLLQEERERHLRQISTLWEITSALSESLDM
ncbi:MAG TPA: PAS domain-containing protein, partial [Syntrophales bacterium]|nr:PAS domain-containing protein [Syntrophales bacterium]